jgi:hypothetical protein
MKSTAEKILIDSGPLTALFDKSDKHHERAKAFLKTYRGEIITNAAVVTEVVYLLDFGIQTQINFLHWVSLGAVTVDDINRSTLIRLVELFKKYSDLPIDFADASLIALGEKLGITKIATIDSDFYIYRTKDKKAFENIFF